MESKMNENHEEFILDSSNLLNLMVGIKRVMIWRRKEVEYFLSFGSDSDTGLNTSVRESDFIICIRNPYTGEMEATEYKDKDGEIGINICVQVLRHISNELKKSNGNRWGGYPPDE